MKAHDLAKQAADILNERGQQNGYDNGEERSAAKIAKVFNTITGRDLTEQEAWLFMICLKLVREGNKHQTDNCVDMANYAFLRAESFGVVDMKAAMTTPPVFGGVPGCVGPGFKTGPSFLRTVREFTPHNGGECPVPPENEVVTRFRNGDTYGPHRADQFRWSHLGWPRDIVGYYVVGEVTATVHDEIQVTIEKPDLLTPEQVQNYVTETVMRATKPGGILRSR